MLPARCPVLGRPKAVKPNRPWPPLPSSENSARSICFKYTHLDGLPLRHTLHAKGSVGGWISRRSSCLARRFNAHHQWLSDRPQRWPSRSPCMMVMAAPRLGSIGICIKLKVRKDIDIKSNAIVVFDEILSAPSNLDADLMVPAGRPFRKRCWLPDLQLIIRID